MDKENDLLKKKNIIEKNEFEEQVRILKIEINDYKNEKKKI